MGVTVAEPKPEGRSAPKQRRNYVDIAGRGGGGKSTLAYALYGWAKEAGRTVMLADANRNSTLADLCPETLRPPSDDTNELKEWHTTNLGAMVTNGVSLMTDLGPGSDRLMQEYGHDLDVVGYCEDQGWNALAIFMCGPDMDDFSYVVRLVEAGYFVPTPSVIVLNEGVVRSGKSAASAFADIRAHPDIAVLQKAGVIPVSMPPLRSMEEARASGLTLQEVAAGKAGRSGKAMDPARRTMVEKWLKRMRAEFVEKGVEGYLP